MSQQFIGLKFAVHHFHQEKNLHLAGTLIKT